MARYFNVKYNFFSENRQEGVFLLEAILCVSILFVCSSALMHLYTFCIINLQKSVQRLHLLSCARRNLYNTKDVVCKKGCQVSREEYVDGGVVWTIVHTRLEDVVISLVRITGSL